MTTMTYATLPAHYAALAEETSQLGARYTAAHNQALTLFIQALTGLKQHYSKEQAEAAYTTFAALPENVQTGLLKSRLYQGDTYITLGDFISIKEDKGIINLPKSATVEGLQAFEKAENGIISPQPTKGTKKVDRAQAAAALENATGEAKTAYMPRELTAAEKNLRKLKSALTTISKLASEANLSAEIVRIENLAADLTAKFAAMVTADAEADLKAKAEVPTLGGENETKATKTA